MPPSTSTIVTRRTSSAIGSFTGSAIANVPRLRLPSISPRATSGTETPSRSRTPMSGNAARRALAATVLDQTEAYLFVQYHEDQDRPNALQKYWAKASRISANFSLDALRKSNSGQLGKRYGESYTACSRSGSTTRCFARACRGWIDCRRSDRSKLDSPSTRGVAQPGIAPALGAGDSLVRIQSPRLRSSVQEALGPQPLLGLPHSRLQVVGRLVPQDLAGPGDRVGAAPS